MPRRRAQEPPRYCGPHKTGQAYCYFHGRHYLGAHGSPESYRRHQEHVQAWRREQQGMQLPQPGCSVLALAAAFLEHASEHYLDPDGQPTSELAHFRMLVGQLVARFGRLAADDFRGAELRALRKAWEGTVSTRTTNSYVSRIRLIWRWGVEQDLVRPETLTALGAVRHLRAPAGLERPPVPPVDSQRVNLTLPHLRSPVAAMVRLQAVIGCRPGEICRMRGCEIDRQGVVRLRTRAGLREVQLPGGVWVWQPQRYKTRRRGKNLAYILGPRAQELLLPWLRDDPEDYLFRPVDGIEEGKRLRVAPGKVSRPRPKKRRRRLGQHYAVKSYNSIIARACRKADIQPWHVNQLRHAVLSRYDRLGGIEAASTVVQHGSVDTTAIYAERDLLTAAELVSQYG